jgi:hypothetical protein
MYILAVLLLPLLTSCAGMLPDVATITHDICDSVVCVEVDRDAFKQDTDVHITVDVINKDIPKSKIASS